VTIDTPDEPPPALAPDTLPEYVRALLDPALYSHAPDRVELVQTHLSYVFLVGDRVFKTKKPVNFGFIDQVELEERRLNCEREVTLNRRLSTGVYLGVLKVLRLSDGSYTLTEGEPPPGAETVEYAVEMTRLPDDRILASLLERDEVPPTLMHCLAARLLEFHEHAAVVPNDSSFAGAEAERNWWAREQGEAEPFIGSTWEPNDATTLKSYVASVLERESALFDQRLADGRVIDGHGDLHAMHIYLIDDEIEIVDCLEFTEWFQFRLEDAGYDIAFTAMDLEARGHRALGDEVAGRYIAAAGDETMSVLQPLHRAFRAFVRGKVESMGAHAPEVPPEQQAELAHSASRYFVLASKFAERAVEPMLIVLAGVSGTGKSTVGATLAARIGAAYVSSDVVRKSLAGIPARKHVPAERTAEVYSTEMSARTYEELRTRTAAHLAAGRPVVLDATHSSAADRTAALQLARDAQVPALIVELRITDEESLARIADRASDPLATSDATAEVYARQTETFEPIATSEGVHLALDASQDLDDLVDEIADSLSAAG
jgi:aminoglycoside phosphotransferase family enzyme/predicted kinase